MIFFALVALFDIILIWTLYEKDSISLKIIATLGWLTVIFELFK